MTDSVDDEDAVAWLSNLGRLGEDMKVPAPPFAHLLGGVRPIPIAHL